MNQRRRSIRRSSIQCLNHIQQSWCFRNRLHTRRAARTAPFALAVGTRHTNRTALAFIVQVVDEWCEERNSAGLVLSERQAQPRGVASRLWEHRNLGYRGARSLVRDDDKQIGVDRILKSPYKQPLLEDARGSVMI